LNLQYIILSSFAIFLLGMFGVTFYRSFLSVMVSFQLITLASLINFFGFSLFLYEASRWDKTFIFFAFVSIYLMLFSIVFYNYSTQTGVYELDVKRDFRFFRFSKSDWWGEDKIGDD
jgi:NADH:ubiquinone oxidoreductase subunit K